MLHIEKTHSMDEYLELLDTSKTIYIDSNRLDMAVQEAGYLADDYKALTLLELRIEASGSYPMLTPDYIISFLEDIGVDFYSLHRKRKTKGPSLDMKKVVEPLIERGVAVELLTNYKMHRSYKSYHSFLRELRDSKHKTKISSDGRIISEYDTHLIPHENLRVYYKDIAVVSIPKVFSNIVTTPSEWYHLAWCDFPQADWRFAYNLFIQNKNNFDIMRSCDDAYEGLARIVEGDSFNEKDFKEHRKDYKVKCLSVLYNSRDKKSISTKLREYYYTCERYKRYVYDLSVLYKFKIPIPCDSYFGYTQLLPEGSYPDAFISKGLNTPVQTFTSHIVNETVFGILEKFWSLGYSSEDINVYYVRHDEPLFVFKDTILKDAWVFEDCSEIHIDGFTPIKLEFHFGNHYQEEDEHLTSMIKNNMNNHPELISRYPVGVMKDYYPVPSVESLHLQFFVVDNNGGKAFKMVVHNYRTNSKMLFVSNHLGKEDALLDIMPDLLEKLNNPKYLLIRNDYLDFSEAVGEETYLRVIPEYDSSVAVVLDGADEK